jgi:hypothetical protein
MEQNKYDGLTKKQTKRCGHAWIDKENETKQTDAPTENKPRDAGRRWDWQRE